MSNDLLAGAYMLYAAVAARACGAKEMSLLALLTPD
jgi:hypothetical protein